MPRVVTVSGGFLVWCMLVTCAWHPSLGAEPAPAEEAVFKGHEKMVYGVAFMPDGRKALTCSFDRTVRLWNVATGEQIAKYDVPDANDIAVSSKGDRAVFACGSSLGTQRVVVWDLVNGREVKNWRGHAMAIKHVRLHPDGKRLVTGSIDGTARLWDLETGAELRQFGEEGGIDSDFDDIPVAVSPDGKFIAGGSWKGNSIHVWETETGKEIRFWRNDAGAVSAIDYSSDGKLLLTGTTNSFSAGTQLWNAETGKLVRAWRCGYTADARFAPSGKRFLTAPSRSDTESELRLWDTDRKEPLARFAGHKDETTKVAFSPDGKTALSVGYDNMVRRWRLPE